VVIEKIRKTGQMHPAWPVLDELEAINDYSRDHHHGEDPTNGSIADQIDTVELAGFVKRTLKLVNNLQGLSTAPGSENLHRHALPLVAPASSVYTRLSPRPFLAQALFYASGGLVYFST
jgi:hypothetical protein